MKSLDNLSFTAENRDRIVANLQGFQQQPHRRDGLRQAAVAVSIFRHGKEAAVILTKRSHALRAHSGQWALPGGTVDDGESAVETALRELREEINLPLGQEDVVGTLDDYRTRSGYLITPVIVWADVEKGDLDPNPGEVASVHAFTFAELTRTDSPHLETIAQSDRQVLSMHFGDRRIYAPTAAVLYQFREVAILGRATRVLHFDQPLFAWK